MKVFASNTLPRTLPYAAKVPDTGFKWSVVTPYDKQHIVDLDHHINPGQSGKELLLVSNQFPVNWAKVTNLAAVDCTGSQFREFTGIHELRGEAKKAAFVHFANKYGLLGMPTVEFPSNVDFWYDSEGNAHNIGKGSPIATGELFFHWKNECRGLFHAVRLFDILSRAEKLSPAKKIEFLEKHIELRDACTLIYPSTSDKKYARDAQVFSLRPRSGNVEGHSLWRYEEKPLFLKIAAQWLLSREVSSRLLSAGSIGAGLYFKDSAGIGNTEFNYQPLTLRAALWLQFVASMSGVSRGLCQRCGKNIPPGSRSDAIYCCKSCKSMANREKHEQAKYAARMLEEVNSRNNEESPCQ